MTGSGGQTNTACAACKYQRRKCTEDCPLSPYFPPDQPKRFQNVHKLFGVSNILRILKHVDPSKREDTIKSITYEADTREKDPVHGCLGVITILQNQVSKLKDELSVTRDQLYLLQQHYSFTHLAQMQQHQQQHQQQQIVGSTLGGSTSVVTVSTAAQETPNVLMMQQQQHDDISSGFAKSNVALPISTSSCFEPDQYLRTDNFNDIKPASAVTRFDMARYIQGDSPPVQQRRYHQQFMQQAQEQQRGSAASKAEGEEDRPSGAASRAFTDRYHTSSQLLQSMDVDDTSFDELHTIGDPYATAIRRRGYSSTSSGGAGRLLNLTVASDSELRRRASSTGGGHHELRRAGVYLTLTNN